MKSIHRGLLSANKAIHNRKFVTIRRLSSQFILGIETSCDDTGCAILDDSGQLLAESLHSQNLVHLRNGGIIPDIAQELHKSFIRPTVDETLHKANISMEKISAIAVTLKPGLPLSLAVGMKYAKLLARRYNKPIIPIHHMEAHALAVRMNHNVSFPFLVLLISGGHCLLAVAQDVNYFQLLGQSIDSAPGEVFDKVARDFKLKNLPEYSKLCGGQAIEEAAAKATHMHTFPFPLALAEVRDCNFSFNGLKTTATYHHYKRHKDHDTVAHHIIPEVYDLCEGLLAAVTRHLVHRTQRAMQFCEIKNLIPNDKKLLVVSGGVACNNYIFNGLRKLCEEFDYSISRPPSKLCTDNGVMIAWNGLEKWKRNLDIVTDIDSLDIVPHSPLGESLIEDVAEAKIKTKLIKLRLLKSSW